MLLEEITPAGPVVVGSSGALPAEILPLEDQKRIASRPFGQSAVGGGFFGGLQARGLADIAPVWLAVAIPIVGAEIGVALMESGLMTSAAEASAAATASGATAAQASAAAAAATAQATTVGTALANAGTAISQGVPADKAVTNAIVNAGIQTGSPAAATKINELIGNPSVTNMITSAGASIVQTAATGGNEADAIRNAKGAIVGSGLTSATGSNVVGRAAGGGVTGGVTGALAGAAGAIGSDAVKPAGTKTALDTSKDVLLAAGPGFTMGGEGSGADQYGITPEQKQGIAGYLAASSSSANSGVFVDDEGAYRVNDLSNNRQFKFSADGSFLGSAMLVSNGNEQTSQIVKDFLSAPAIQQIPESNKSGFASTSTQTTTGGGSTGVTGTGVSGDTGAGTAGGEGVTPAPLSTEVQDKITELGGILGLGTPSSNPEGYTALKGGASGGGQSRMGIFAIDKDQQQKAIIFLDNLAFTNPQDKKAIDNLKSNIAQTPIKQTTPPQTSGGAAGGGGGGGNITGNVVISGLPGGGVIERPGYGTGDQQISTLIGGGRGDEAGGGGNTPGAGTGTGTGTKGTGTGAGTGGTGTKGGGTKASDEEEPTPKKEDGYRPDLFIYGGKSPKTPGRQTTNLGTTLQAPFYPTSTLGQALTGYRGAGEIEGKKSGKPRQNVWNEESLRLKDALGL